MNPIDVPEPPEPNEVPDLDNLVLNRPLARRTLTIAFGVIGFSLAGLTILAAILLIQVHNTADSNRKAIKRLDRLTQPTPKQFEEDLKKGIERCLRFPDCRRLFPAIERQRRRNSATVPHRGNSPETTLDRTPRTVAVAPESQRGIAAPQSSRPTATTNPPRRRRKPSGGSSPSSPPPPQSSGPTPPSATIPAPVQICSDLLRVNCP